MHHYYIFSEVKLGKFNLIHLLTYQGPEDKEDTSDDPGLYCCEAFRLGNICSDGVENVHQNKKDCNQKRHPGKVIFKLLKHL